MFEWKTFPHLQMKEGRMVWLLGSQSNFYYAQTKQITVRWETLVSEKFGKSSWIHQILTIQIFSYYKFP